MTRRAPVFCALAGNPLYPCKARDRHATDCASPDCGPACTPNKGEDFHDGHCRGCLPRLAADGSRLCHHHRDQARRNLRELVQLDAALTVALVASGRGSGVGPVTGTKDVGINLDENAMDTRAVIRERLAALVATTVDERGVNAPTNWAVPAIIAWLDRHHDWWCDHDTQAAITWHNTLALRVMTARSAAYPSGARRLPTGLPCEEHTTSDTGDRVPCPGKLTTLSGGNRYADLVCTADNTHRITPAEWQKSAFRNRLKGPLNAGAVKALAGRITA